MAKTTSRVVGRRAWQIAVVAMALLLATACVGRPKETPGQFASFLPQTSGTSATPKNVGGTSDTSGLGAGMLQSPGSAPAATATPKP